MADPAGTAGGSDEAGVLLNASADVLIENEVFDRQERECLDVVQSTVGQLGFENGASLSAILAEAQALGLALCPAVTGPYLRLVSTGQTTAPDSVMSNGSAPSGSITVASAPLEDDDDYPKGFYLRVVDGVPWLRGYHASDEHIWSPHDCFAFIRP
jgi:hypothetical protein